MSHFDFVRPSGQWPTELVPGSNDYQRWDVAQAKTVDGDNGGTWAPSKPIIIGGAGVVFNTVASTATGGVTTATSGRVAVPGSTPPSIAAPTVSDTIIVPALRLKLPSGAASLSTGLQAEEYFATSFAPGAVGVQTMLTSGVVLEIPRRYLHNGASLIHLTMRFRVVTSPASLPATQFTFQPLAWNAGGTAQQALKPGQLSHWNATHAYLAGDYVTPNATPNGLYFKCTTPGTSGGSEPVWNTTISSTTNDGSVVWTCTGRSGQLAAATPAAYYNSGQPQSVTYDFDGLTPAIDLTTYRYGVTIIGAADSSTSDPTGNILIHSLEIDVGNIGTLGFE